MLKLVIDTVVPRLVAWQLQARAPGGQSGARFVKYCVNIS
jgi:hypothetical protein